MAWMIRYLLSSKASLICCSVVSLAPRHLQTVSYGSENERYPQPNLHAENCRAPESERIGVVFFISCAFIFVTYSLIQNVPLERDCCGDDIPGASDAMQRKQMLTDV